MIEPTETFEGTWPYEAHFFEGAGFRMRLGNVHAISL
jgi:hypothetical protein